MCGIAGIIGKNKAGIQVETILNRIKYRGPDGLFYWNNDSVSFGHARLSIIDLTASANQPMTDASTGNVIVFNGEIYNYLEIKKSIGSAYAFRTNSDTEVILAAYKIYGIGFLEHLQGMFSMAIYDAMQDKILCARDRFGVKPFYYRNIGQNFVFASEIKAIINLTQESESINSLKVYEFLANRQQDTNEETFFNSVTQLSPAHYMWVSTTGENEAPQCYWTYPSLGERKFDEGARKELVDIFDKTMQYHLRSDVNVGGFLSGGLDSSSIACFAVRNMSQQSYPAFSAILPYHHAENVLIKEVLNANPKMAPHTFLLDGNDFFDDIGDVIYHHDEPVLDGSMYAHYKLCQLAKENGIKVLLSGSGGDELFGGYASHIHSYHATLLSSLRLKKYLTELGKVARNSIIPTIHCSSKVFTKTFLSMQGVFLKTGRFKTSTGTLRYSRRLTTIIMKRRTGTMPTF